MHLPRARTVFPDLVWEAQTGSTNAELRRLSEEARRAGSGLAPFTAVATTTQTAGRGRLGRSWHAAPGDTLALSVLVPWTAPSQEKEAPAQRRPPGLPLGWLPLVVGSAVAGALREFAPGSRVGVKWPNDVRVEHSARRRAAGHGDSPAKICGILCEVDALREGDPAAASVIVGMGINLFAPDERLATDTATSLAAEGAIAPVFDPEVLDRCLAALGTALRDLVSHTTLDARAVRARVEADSVTLGTRVRVHQPDGSAADGRATAIAEDGALRVVGDDGVVRTFAAGDVQHLR